MNATTFFFVLLGSISFTANVFRVINWIERG